MTADFDEFGGASLELVAWELCIEESAVSAAWSRAIADGLLERCGTDEVPSEETWRLTTRGRRAYEGSDDASACDSAGTVIDRRAVTRERVHRRAILQT